jgi:hypothetical protein
MNIFRAYHCACRYACRYAYQSRADRQAGPRMVCQQGQSSVEYLVICAAIAFALGLGMLDNTSVLRQLLDAFKTAYQNFSYAISLPG